MYQQLHAKRNWRNSEKYILYWAGYLLLFTLIEGSTKHDFFAVCRNELLSLAPKVLFVWLVIEKLFPRLFDVKRRTGFIFIYIILLVAFALMMRLVDNYIILHYFLTYWVREPLLSAAPFLYNIIKLQFVLAIPFCAALYRQLYNERNKAQQPESLRIKCDRRMVSLLFNDIAYIEAQGNYLVIYTPSGNLRTYLSISEMEEKLPDSKFIRIHRSYLVALDRVDSYSHDKVIIGGKSIPIGRSYRLKTKLLLN